MKRIYFSIILISVSLMLFSQEDNAQFKIDSIEKTFTYQHGKIELKNGVASIIIPEGFKYLDAIQAERVLVDLWGNPKGDNLSLGLILPEKDGVLSENSYVFNVQYDEIGYVKDDDADDIDYDELLTQLKKDTEEENKLRQKEGYEQISVIGWAAKPFYDADKKILHWAKELRFGNQPVNTLNYNVRILGRKGVIVLNAIATKNELGLVKKDINKVLNIVTFNPGYQYDDFDASIDEVAAWTIGGLVAGKILTKVGIFAIVAKFGKIIVLGFLGFFGVFKNKIKSFFSKKRKEEDTDDAEKPQLIEDSNETVSE